jgi:hypothetical protein
MDDTDHTQADIWLKRARYLGGWVTLLRDTSHILTHGWGRTLIISDGGWTGNQVCTYLHRKHIQTWTPSFNGHDFKVRVPRNQARRANQLLTKAGLTVTIV